MIAQSSVQEVSFSRDHTAIVYPIGVYKDFFNTDIYTIIGVLVGYSSKVSEWWFVCQYIILMLIAPLLIGLFSENRMTRALSILLLLGVYGFYYLGAPHLTGTTLGTYFFLLFVLPCKLVQCPCFYSRYSLQPF